MSQESTSTNELVGAGTVEALLDLSFTKFITIRIVKLLYVLILGLIGLGWIIGVIVLAGQFGLVSFSGFLMLIALTLLLVVEVIFARVALELIVVLFRIGENTTVIAGRAAEPK